MKIKILENSHIGWGYLFLIDPKNVNRLYRKPCPYINRCASRLTCNHWIIFFSFERRLEAWAFCKISFSTPNVNFICKFLHHGDYEMEEKRNITRYLSEKVCKSVNTNSFSIFIGHKTAADRTGKETCKGFEKTSGQFSIYSKVELLSADTRIID